ncbi:coagulation factor 5/8 type domain protein [Catenulispora acidiphila DSM 44928]|uniref:Coagulation factor 5/8 type domain protein n=1 Tax=Catenulispora acidiphila (strain DSM 44928 / JCM 14897 / NBRC 102108 / NRRL B-24433 / ID139908) TaxID=479433 RepID=C7Q4B8_CATAD|nr:discoidin domain-containing protein [Catenulispora acidiphila]ACU69978.1 coagulation factor 5/8 type domain protein [Catenulispora acidiphila DSM 44928]
MAQESNQPFRASRRTVVAAASTLLAGFAVDTAFPSVGFAAEPGKAGVPGHAPAPGELAMYRPIEVSSTDYAPTPGAFAVDRVTSAGVRGTGWRAAAGDPQWISVDLQAVCQVTSVHLTFEAAAGDPVFVKPTSGNWADGTTGKELLSSYASAFVVEVSTDKKSWTSVYQTASGTGGAVVIDLAAPVSARWVRLTASKRSDANPLGLNGFQVYGSASGHRPAATGWTDWGTHDNHAPGLVVAADGTVPLESGWVLTMDDWAPGDGTALSVPTVDTSGWLPATVPGTVLASLVEQGHLPDPVAGFNNLRIPEALSRHSWWYKRDFALPAALGAGHGRRIWLEFDGVNHQAALFLNGAQIGSLTYPFARAAIEVTEHLVAGEQSLAVKIDPMPIPGSPGDKGPAGQSWVDAGAQIMNMNSPTYLAASGWDWMPAVRDRVSGIWNHVRLRSTGDVVIGDPRVDTVLPALPDTTSASVTIVVPVRNAGSADVSATVTASFDTVRLSQTVTVPAGKNLDVTFAPAKFAQLNLRDPKLWWPNGYGDANLHTLNLAVTVAGQRSDQRTTRFGIRQFDYEYKTPLPFVASADAYTQTTDLGARQARYVRINCQTRATGWGFSLWTLSVLNSATPGTDLALHQPTTASTQDPSNPVTNATDGDANTRWSSDFADDQWIEVDLGASVSFDQVAITWEQAYARTYTVQVSTDGSVWTDAKSVDNTAIPLPFNGGDASLDVESFAAASGRYVRISGGVRETSWGNSLWSLSVLNSATPGVDLALHKTATASTEDPSNPAANATDGNSGTRWSSDYADNQWIQVDLGSSQTFDGVGILWEQAYPKTYVIQVSDDGSSWTDVKTVGLAPESLKISVNGVRVLCRGGNWGWDELLRRMPSDRMDAAIRMHRDMNFTMVRNWVGASNREEFYAACDEFGLLVWNDFPNAWGMDPPDHDAYNSIAADTVLRYRIHPSVVVWCGANEGNPPQAIDEGMRNAVTNGAPGILYQSNSAGGNITGGGPYYWVEPETYYDPATYGSHSFGFHTEIGMPVVSTADSLRNMAGEQPAWPIGGPWYYHDWSQYGNQSPLQYQAAIEARLQTSNTLEDFARKAQFVNYENARAMFEAWNANLWADASGLMLWMSHPAWHSTVWQTYDYDFDVNGMYYGARKACEPVHVQADPVHWQVVAVNHTPHAVSGATVSARLFDLSGRQLGTTQSAAINVAVADSAKAFAVAWTDALPDLHLLRLTLQDASGKTLSENTYWRYRAPSAMQALNKAQQTRITASITGATSGGDGRRQLTATVRNQGSSVAAMVRLSLQNRASGQRVLPTLYGENYVWLLPGETRTIIVSFPSSALPKEQPELHVEGYNTSAVIARA